jgi:hypothetical protein
MEWLKRTVGMETLQEPEAPDFAKFEDGASRRF